MGRAGTRFCHKPPKLSVRLGRAPGTHGHLLRVMDVRAAFATVTPAKAVVIHAVFSLLLFLLLCLPDDGQASLDSPAIHRKKFVSPRMSREVPTFPASRDAPGQGTTAAGDRVRSSYRGNEQVTSGHSPITCLSGLYLLPANPSWQSPLNPPPALSLSIDASSRSPSLWEHSTKNGALLGPCA